MILAVDHFPLLVLLATLMSGFAALLWKDDSRARSLFFLKALFGIVGCAVLLGYVFAAVSR